MVSFILLENGTFHLHTEKRTFYPILIDWVPICKCWLLASIRSPFIFLNFRFPKIAPNAYKPDRRFSLLIEFLNQFIGSFGNIGSIWSIGICLICANLYRQPLSSSIVAYPRAHLHFTTIRRIPLVHPARCTGWLLNLRAHLYVLSTPCVVLIQNAWKRKSTFSTQTTRRPLAVCRLSVQGSEV